MVGAHCVDCGAVSTSALPIPWTLSRNASPINGIAILQEIAWHAMPWECLNNIEQGY
jgi:hypothetical protein